MLAYIFDFDGVVVDSIALHIKAWQIAYRELFDQDLEYPQKLAGMASSKIAAKLCARQNRPDRCSQLIDLKRSLMSKISHTVELLPGARETLLVLKAQGIPYAICSNATRNFIDFVLDLHALDAQTIVSIESTDTPKPHPAPYLLALERMSLDKRMAHKVAAFEDSRHGMRAAQKAGLYGIGILSLHTADELTACGAQKVFSSLEEAKKDPEVFPQR